MANLTITVDDEVLRQARIRALERRESVNSYLADMLRRYAGSHSATSIEAFLELAESDPGGEPGVDRTWSRDDLHRV